MNRNLIAAEMKICSENTHVLYQVHVSKQITLLSSQTANVLHQIIIGLCNVCMYLEEVNITASNDIYTENDARLLSDSECAWTV